MALRMSQMLRSSQDLRGGRSRTAVLEIPRASPRVDPDEPMMAAVAAVAAVPQLPLVDLAPAVGVAGASEIDGRGCG